MQKHAYIHIWIYVIYICLYTHLGFPGGSVVKNPPANAGDMVRSLVEKIPWRRKWQPLPVFLPGKSQGQKSLAGYSWWDHKRVGYNLDTKQQPYTHSHVYKLHNVHIYNAIHVVLHAVMYYKIQFKWLSYVFFSKYKLT